MRYNHYRIEFEKKLHKYLEISYYKDGMSGKTLHIGYRWFRFAHLLEFVFLNGETVKGANDFGIYCKYIDNTCIDSDDCDNCIHPPQKS